LQVPFKELHRYVTELSAFNDDPKMFNDGTLQAIQTAWHAEFLDRTQ
jgi:FeS assembly protein IscX